jgi:deoxyribodipyrimidine photolyase
MEQQAEQGGEQTVLMLFRKDLRLDDNPALLAALQAAKRVVREPASASPKSMLHAQHRKQHPSAAAGA